MHRSELTIDLGALRRNVRTLLHALDGAALWAVVKADGYGHGAVDVAKAALDAGAGALCVATVAEGLELRQELREPRILVMGPVEDARAAHAAKLELTVGQGYLPTGIPLHVKLDTGMGRYGFSELPSMDADVVGVMSHLATADSDPAFAREQVERFRQATEGRSVTRHLANRGAAPTLP